MRKLVSFLLIVFILAASISVSNNPIQAAAYNHVTVTVDGKMIDFPDVEPYINEDGRTMVPVRFITENIGCKVDWDGQNQIVIISKDKLRIALTVGRYWAIVNNGKSDEMKHFDTKALLKTENGETRTMVPLRFITETMGIYVGWNAETNTVLIDTKRAPVPEDIVPPTPTPIPSHANMVEKLDLVEGFETPEGFIKPDLSIVHVRDGSAGYFDVLLNNLQDYKDNGAENYYYRTTCTSHDLVNWEMNGFGTEFRRLDEYRVSLDYIITSREKRGHTSLDKPQTIWIARKYEYKNSFNPNAETLLLKDGMKLDIEVRFKMNDFEQVYRKTVTIHER